MIEITDQTFEQEVLKSDVPVFVDFYANWCGPCKAAAPTVEELAEKYVGRVKFCKLDVDTGAEFALKFKVTGIPNFHIFKGGTSVFEFVGFRPGFDETISEALDKLLAS
jgi:thioredoxin